jgi:hypothetical protein
MPGGDPMARAEVTYRFSTGESISCIVSTTAEHPDALDEMTIRARRLFAEVMADQRLEVEPEGGDS